MTGHSLTYFCRSTYLLPILLSILLIVTSQLFSLVSLKNTLTAAALFAVIGVAVFLAELLLSPNRSSARNDAYTLLTNLLIKGGPQSASNILNFDEVCAIESNADEIWIYSYDLGWEGDSGKFSDIVLGNLLKGVKYRYIVPQNKQVQIRIDSLLQKYSAVKNRDKLIIYRSRPRQLKLVQFGVVIYNPTISKKAGRSPDECVVIFFPHFQTSGPRANDAAFISMRGVSTVEIQEGFLELWDESTEIEPIDKRKSK
jgi:hypothetical protein